MTNANATPNSTMTPSPAGWYLLTWEGSGWVAVHLSDGTLDGFVEEANADTHRTADDRYAPIVAAIQAETWHAIADDQASQVRAVAAEWIGELAAYADVDRIA
jgi:hypothetical protein